MKHTAALSELMNIRNIPAIDGEVSFSGADPFFKTPFRVGDTAAQALAATGVAANDIWQLKTGRRQKISVDVRHAAAMLRTVDYSQVREADGRYANIPIPADMAYMLTVTQPWKTADGRWFLPHFNLKHLAERVCGVLRCDYTPTSVAAAVAKWKAEDLEIAIAEAHACGGIVRTPQEWLDHPQGRIMAQQPVVKITKVADGDPMPFPAGERPLSGVRVLDLTRILAGPICGRTLAEHGADVLMVTAPDLPQTPEHVRDTSHGKRSCFLDIRTENGAARLCTLVQDADVFVDGYRPGRLTAHGFGAADLLKLRRGLVRVSISCFGSKGPFATRAGWEQVAQIVTGICHINGKLRGDDKPKLVFAPLCDYTTGFLAAYGTMLALARRAREGGSYEVEVALCHSAMLVQRQGYLDDFSHAPERLSTEEFEAISVQQDGCYGHLKVLGPALQMSETPCRWDKPTPQLGADAPMWLPR